MKINTALILCAGGSHDAVKKHLKILEVEMGDLLKDKNRFGEHVVKSLMQLSDMIQGI